MDRGEYSPEEFDSGGANYRSNAHGRNPRHAATDVKFVAEHGRQRGHQPEWRDNHRGHEETRSSHRSHSDHNEPTRKYTDSSNYRDFHVEPERSTRDSGNDNRDAGRSYRYPDHTYRKETGSTSERESKRDYRSSEQSQRKPERNYRDAERNVREPERSNRDYGRTHRDSEASHRDPGRSHRDSEASHRDPGSSHRDSEASHRDPGRSHRDSEARHRDPRRSFRDGEQNYQGVERSVRNSDRSHRDSNRNNLEPGRNADADHRSDREERSYRPRVERSDVGPGTSSDLHRQDRSARPHTSVVQERGRPREQNLGGGAERRTSSTSLHRQAIKRPRSDSVDPDSGLSQSMALMGSRRMEIEEVGNGRHVIEEARFTTDRVDVGRDDEVAIDYGRAAHSEGEDKARLGGLTGAGAVVRVASGRGSGTGSSSGDVPGPSNPGGEGGRAGARRGVRLLRTDRFDNVRTRPATLNSKCGSSGQVVSLIANFFPLRMKPSWCLFNYRVDFKPDEERTAVKKRLLRVHDTYLGGYIFDGSNMYTASRLSPEPLVVYSERELDQVKMELTLRLVGQVSPGDVQYLQFYNIIVRSCLQLLEFEELGRHFYDRHAAIRMPHHRLELWPGYITTLRNYENNLMLCVEVTHKVLRLDNCLSLINHLMNKYRNKEQAVTEELVGSIVMTHYNRKTYRVDDIEWKQNPGSTFEQKGTPVSLAQYYFTKYQLRISDMKQPLLVSRPKKRDCHRGDDGPILLIPELCQMTGLSDEIRKNYKTMRELATYLQQPPERRVQNIQNFMSRLRGSSEIRGLLTNWGLEFENKLVSVKGRVVPQEQVIFRMGTHKDMVPVGAGADWNFAFKTKNMYSSVRMLRWAIIVTQRDYRNVDNLLHTMRTVGAGLDFHVGNPLELVRVGDTRVQTFVNGVNQVVSNHKDLDMIFIILPGPQHELYSAVKKRCCIDYGIASQCFLAKHIQPNAKGLMSIVTKVVVQMNAKMGGEPWTTNNPLKASNTMIIGFDVYHCGKRKGASVGAIVCTTNNELSKYYSTVSFHSGRDELSERLCTDITKCVYAFRSKNKNALPDRIIMYRDGVGEGQLNYVFNTELEQIRSALKNVYNAAGIEPARFTAIIVTKKGNARIFYPQPNGHIKNPDAGTIVDNVITLPERYDFFLVAQSSKQGTVSPTSYNVIWDEQGLEPDKIQRLTFKLCHLYYNWSGTVAVPAVCQYAHKLAYLTGLSLGSPSNENLSHYLYFL